MSSADVGLCVADCSCRLLIMNLFLSPLSVVMTAAASYDSFSSSLACSPVEDEIYRLLCPLKISWQMDAT